MSREFDLTCMGLNRETRIAAMRIILRRLRRQAQRFALAAARRRLNGYTPACYARSGGRL